AAAAAHRARAVSAQATATRGFCGGGRGGIGANLALGGSPPAAACSPLSPPSVMVPPQLKRRPLLPQPPLPPPRPSAASSPSCSATSLARLNWPYGSMQRTCTTSSPPIIAASPR